MKYHNQKKGNDMLEPLTLDSIFNKPRTIPAIVQRAVELCSTMPDGALLDIVRLSEALCVSREHFKKYAKDPELVPYRFKVGNIAYYANQNTVEKAKRRKKG